MRSMAAQSVGVDISKDTLDVAIHPGGESFRIANNPEGHRALIKRLKGFDIARIVFEATGAYHRLLQQALVEAGLPWVKVSPRQARRFARPRENSPRLTGATPFCLPAWAQLWTSSRARPPARRSRP